MTRLELRRRILHSLNDDPQNPVFWTTGEIDEYIQDGMEMLAEESEALVRTFHIPRRDGHFVYHIEGLGENIMVPFRIWLPDLKRRLESWSLTDLDARHEKWMTVDGDPWVWAPIDWRSFVIWPSPATGGGWLEVSCYVWPEPLQDDASRPEFLPADHEAFVSWGEQEGYLKQHIVVQAVDSARTWAERWGKADTRASVKQMQSAFHVRRQR